MLLHPRGSLQTPDSCPRLLICSPHGPQEPLLTSRPAPSGCLVNRVISHAHLDSCESGPLHPSWPAPKTSLGPLIPRSLLGVLHGLRFGGWVLGALSLLAGLPEPLEAPIPPLSILPQARVLCSGPKMPPSLSLCLSVLPQGSSSAALPKGSAQCSGTQAAPPLLAPN